MPQPTVRRQTLTSAHQGAIRERFYARFYDPAFDEVRAELEQVFEKAWDGYIVYRKSPRQQPAGPGYADPTHKLPSNGCRPRLIDAAEQRQKIPLHPRAS